MTSVISAGLAISGGKPVRERPLPVRLQFDHRELQAVDRLFREVIERGGNFDRYGYGEQANGTTASVTGTYVSEVDRFETELAEFYGVRYVTAVSSGSGAVQAALAALDLEPGTEVITSPLTDPGVVMAILFLGCVPVFVDHDYDTASVSPAAIEDAITPYTGAIVVTHLMGLVCDMDSVMGIAERRGLPVIGDSAQAHGSLYRGSRSRPFGDIGAVSMMSTKHMTSGGQGGFVATNDERRYWAAKRFADRGKPFGLPVPRDGAPHGGDRHTIGINARMHDLEAAVGRVQLAKLPGIVDARSSLLRRLYDGLGGLETVRPVRFCDGAEPNPWGALFSLDRSRLSVDAARFAAAMTAEGVPTVRAIPDMIPIVDELSFVRACRVPGRARFPYGYELRGRVVQHVQRAHPVIDRLATDLLLIWIHEGWSDAEVTDTLSAFRKVEIAYRRT